MQIQLNPNKKSKRGKQFSNFELHFVTAKEEKSMNVEWL